MAVYNLDMSDTLSIVQNKHGMLKKGKIPTQDCLGTNFSGLKNVKFVFH